MTDQGNQIDRGKNSVENASAVAVRTHLLQVNKGDARVQGQITGGSPLAGNILLGQLGAADRALVVPRLQQVSAAPGTIIFDAGDVIDVVYFPQTLVVSIEEVCEEATCVEVALVGMEGIIGWPALLGCERATNRAVVRMQSGTMLGIQARDLLAACRESASLWLGLLRFVEVMSVQMNRAIVSHLRDSIQRRLARWLLMRQDRIGGNELQVRHDEVSANLGVRRASITDALHILEGERLVRCYRGRIVVRDRAALQALAGDAYGIPEQLYRSLIAPFAIELAARSDAPGTIGSSEPRLPAGWRTDPMVLSPST